MTTEQLALELEAPAHRPGRDFDFVAHEIWRAQQRALEDEWRAQRAPAPCRCPRPLLEGQSHCLRCGREVTP